MTRSLHLLLLPILFAGCSMKTARFVPYSNAQARFTADVPSDWTAIENPAGGTPGVQFLAPPPKGRRAVRPYMSADFYAAEGSGQGALDSYLREQTLDRPGVSHGPVADIRAGSWTGKGFTTTRPLPQSPEFAPQGDLSVRTILIPAQRGFYELVLAAPAADAAAQEPAFQRFLESFRPQ